MRAAAVVAGLATLVATAGMMAPSPAVAQQTNWRASATYERQVVRSNLPEWSDWHAWVVEGRRFWDGGNVALELLQRRRFGADDQAGALDGYLNITPRTYIHARVSVAPEARVIPGQDHRLDVFHAHPTGWEGSVGYRFMDVSPTRDVHVLNLSLARYVAEWYLRARGDVNPTFSEMAFFGGATVRRFIPGLSGFVGLSGGLGREVAEIAAGADGPVADLRSSRFAALRAQLFPWEMVGLAGELSYHSLSELPARVGLGASVIIRW